MKKNIIIKSFIIIFSLITIFIIYTIFKENKKEKYLNYEVRFAESIIKESPYTLEEIYAIIENPQTFYEVNKLRYNDFAYTIVHFYDYFSKNTQLKVATKVETDENGKVTKVLEFTYLSYDEFMDFMSCEYDFETDAIKTCKEKKEHCGQISAAGYDWRLTTKRLIYKSIM